MDDEIEEIDTFDYFNVDIKLLALHVLLEGFYRGQSVFSLNQFLKGRITKDIYDKKHQEYQDKMQTLEIELSEHSKADYEYQNTVATVVSVARRAKTIFDNSSEPARKRQFLNYILQNPTVNGKKLCFTIASPFNLVLELADSPNWLPR
jgi:hypothetical protein